MDFTEAKCRKHSFHGQVLHSGKTGEVGGFVSETTGGGSVKLRHVYPLLRLAGAGNYPRLAGGGLRAS